MPSLAVQLESHFADLTDPRRREGTYPLINFIVITMCAVISGADDFVAITQFAHSRKEWLAKFLDLSAGIPSHDRFNAIMGAIKPAEFEKCFLSWINHVHDLLPDNVIAIDGKTLRRSYDTRDSKSAIHMVSAWSNVNNLTLGQVVVEAKSNEITAIPKLLEMLELSGCFVTIDAMGCQTEIAAEIVDGKGHYCLAVKENQPTLFNAIMDHVIDNMEDDFARTKATAHETFEQGHGRVEHRTYYVLPVPKDLPDAHRWKKLTALGVAINHTLRDGKETSAVRLYILSKKVSAQKFGDVVRGHWGIENRLHWQLDVNFNEDQCRVRKNKGDVNLSLARRTALTLLQHEKTAKCGVKNRRLLATLDVEYLEKVLFGK